MAVDVILGLQWGDEGKGKIVDVLAPQYDIIARFQGGPNAGHTLEFNKNKVVLHSIPSGIFYEGKINLIGNGVVLDPVIFANELEMVEKLNPRARQNLLISKRVHLILPTHRLLDAAYENDKGEAKIGSTLKGISPTYTDKFSRDGLRVGDILRSDFWELFDALTQKHMRIISMLGSSSNASKIDGMPYEDFIIRWKKGIELLKNLQLIDSENYLNDCINSGKKILAEGAQGTLLDVDFGSYPFVTSSNTICGGVCTGLGIAPRHVGDVYGIFKAYCTRVGSGPFPTELHDKTGEILQQRGAEFGATTGRPRRCGWLDLVALRYAIQLNGVNKLIMTKADVLDTFETIQLCNSYQFEGKEYNYPPYEICDQQIVPGLMGAIGWKMDTTQITNKEDLPSRLLNYISTIEEFCGPKVIIVSTGPDRKQIISLAEHLELIK